MAELTYLDFSLLIEKSGDRYRARVLDSPAGQATSEFDRPFSELELENFILRVGRPRQGVRRIDSPEMETARKFGTQLFETTFGNEIYTCLISSLNEAANQKKGLRIQMRIEAPELNNFPWEYLYNPRFERFLSLSVDTPIVRYLDLPQRPETLVITPPLRVLVMISSPTDFPSLDVEGEWVKLKEAVKSLEERGLVILEKVETATLACLQEKLRQDEYHIFHFIGHGIFDEGTQAGVLLFEDENERGRMLNGQVLGTILHNHQSLRLVILNACEGARTSNSDPFAGAAQSLVQQGIPAVIAMQFEITDEAAITFSHEFYSALCDGYPVDEALSEARTAIFAQGNDIEWGTPVYFTRSPDGRIFNIDRTPSQAGLPAVKAAVKPPKSPTVKQSEVKEEPPSQKRFITFPAQIPAWSLAVIIPVLLLVLFIVVGLLPLGENRMPLFVSWFYRPPTATSPWIPVSENKSTPTLTATSPWISLSATAPVPSETPTPLGPTDTPFILTVTPTPSATPLPTFMPGQDFEANCISTNIWTPYQGENYPQIKGCWDLKDWGMSAQDGGLVLAVKNSDGKFHALYSPLGDNVQIAFKLNISRLTTTAGGFSNLVFGIGDYTNVPTGEYLIYRVTTPISPIYVLYGNNIRLSGISQFAIYSSGKEQDVVITIRSLLMTISAGNKDYGPIPITSGRRNAFWIGYLLSEGGDLIANITSFRIITK